uniref:Protein kinase domain-containing protein n=2 Tax=Clytia hemisphaerica TaxID=252671 RepID=A0A7M5WLP5_9CNID
MGLQEKYTKNPNKNDEHQEEMNSSIGLSLEDQTNQNGDQADVVDHLKEVNKEQTEKPTKRAKYASAIWDANNRFLTYRSRELSKLKLDGMFKSRTSIMVDAANFSDFLGNVDRVLLECPIEVFEFDDHEICLSNIICNTNSHSISKETFKNGEIYVFKRCRKTPSYSEKRSFTHLAREMKILSLVGRHPNIVYGSGMTWYKSNPCLVLSYESDLTLRNFHKIRDANLVIIKSIIIGLTKAIAFLQDKRILHNMIVPENICLKYNGKIYIPVLVGFSHAIRRDSARTLTLYQQKQFDEFMHMPPEVRKGKVPPSAYSDIYAFTRILRGFMKYPSVQNVITYDMIQTLLDIPFGSELLIDFVSSFLNE